MKKAYAVCMVLVICLFSAMSVAQAAAPKQPDMAKLAESDLSRFKHAVSSLDGYRGDSTLLEAARVELQDILARNPRYAPAHREMARYFIMRGHINSSSFEPGSLEAAEYAINKALEINPEYAEAYVLFGHLYRLMDRHREAVAAVEKAEKLGTNDPWLHNNWADLLIDEGKYEQAAQRYRKVINSKTPNKKAMGAALEGVIRYYIDIGDLNQADSFHRKKIEYEPDAAWGYGNYGQFLLCKKDDYENSIRRSRQALRIMDYGMGRYWLAAALYRKWAQSVVSGGPDSGKRYFNEAFALYPDPHEIAAKTRFCPSLKRVSEALEKSAGQTGVRKL
jgi:Tfp pilus assembly protein PilF